MSDVLARIDGALLNHASSAARAWLQERVDADAGKPRSVAEVRRRINSVFVRPMVELLADEWQTDPADDESWWADHDVCDAFLPHDVYGYRAGVDHDPLATWAHRNPWFDPQCPAQPSEES